MSTSTSSTQSTTPSCSSTPSEPIQIGFSSSTRARNCSNASLLSNSPSPNGPAAFPSWKMRPSLPQGPPSSYMSDEDLFGGDDVPFLDEAPEPPRTAEQWTRSHRGMSMAGNESLVTLASSEGSYQSYGSNFVASKPISMKK